METVALRAIGSHLRHFFTPRMRRDYCLKQRTYMGTRLASHTHARRTGSGAPPTSAARRASGTVSPAPPTATRTRIHCRMAAAHTHPAPAPSDRRSEGRAGSRRIFPPQFKLQVLEAYRRDAQCRGNQRATARKFGIHRRQIQKWLQAEPALRAALLRRAPQPAPSPPPYSAGSPESARLPSPPPAMAPTPVQVPTPLQVPVPLQVPTPLQGLTPLQVPTPMQVQTSLPARVPIPVPIPVMEPIDLSVRRPTPPPALQPAYAPPTMPEPPRKPFKLFRPYLLEDEEDRRPAVASLPVSHGVHVSAFVPVQSAGGCALTACSAPRWCTPVPSYPAPLR